MLTKAVIKCDVPTLVPVNMVRVPPTIAEVNVVSTPVRVVPVCDTDPKEYIRVNVPDANVPVAAVRTVALTNAVIKCDVPLSAPDVIVTVPPTIRGVKVVPTPVSVVPAWDTVPVW